MAQQHVYHWKHGWIPLDHYAALSKAHGSESGAAKLLKSTSARARPDEAAASPAVHKSSLSKSSSGDTLAKVRSLPGEERFKGVHSETYRGNRLTVRKGREWGTLRSEINGHVAGSPLGLTNAKAVQELDSLRGTVDHAHANPDNYTNGLGEISYGMKLTHPAKH